MVKIFKRMFKGCVRFFFFLEREVLGMRLFNVGCRREGEVISIFFYFIY